MFLHLLKLRKRAGIYLLLAFFVSLSLSCGKKEPEKKAKPRATAPVAQQVSSPKTAGPIFVEIVSEISNLPFEEGIMADRDARENLNGYVFEDPGAGKKKLYQATGGSLPEVEKTRLWVGYRVVDLLSHHPNYYQNLESSEKNQLELDTAKDPSLDRLLYDAGPFAYLRIPAKVKVKREKDGTVTAQAGGKTQKLQPGEVKTLVTKEIKITLEAFADEIIKTWKKAELPESAVQKESLLQTVKYLLGSGEIKIYKRISAVFHGSVEVGNFDVLSQWQQSEEKLISGPYEEALSSLENVLLATPEHQEALSRWALTKSLIEKGQTPASVVGTLKFPAGMPNQKQKEIWEKYHAGIAALADPDDPPDFARASGPIEKGKFRLAIPTGEYRLQVHVPGFQVSEQTIRVNGETKVDVSLQAK